MKTENNFYTICSINEYADKYEDLVPLLQVRNLTSPFLADKHENVGGDSEGESIYSQPNKLNVVNTLDDVQQ